MNPSEIIKPLLRFVLTGPSLAALLCLLMAACVAPQSEEVSSAPTQDTAAQQHSLACNTQTQLLTRNDLPTATFDFNLIVEQQYDHFAAQLDMELCNRLELMNVRLELDSLQFIQVLAVTEQECEAGPYPDEPSPRVHFHPVTVLLNQQGKLLLDGALSELHEVPARMESALLSRHRENGYRMQFEIRWDSLSALPLRKQLFANVCKGLLAASDSIAMKMYGTPCCALDSASVAILKRSIQPLFVLRGPLPPPPPPPPIEIDPLECNVD